MKSISLIYLPMLCLLLSFTFVACEANQQATPQTSEQAALVAQYLQEYQAYRNLPVPPYIVEDKAAREALDAKLDKQDNAYYGAIDKEIARRQKAGIDDKESFELFVAQKHAEIYEPEVLDYKAKIKIRVQARKQALEALTSLKLKLQNYYPELDNYNNLEAYEWLQAQDRSSEGALTPLQ